jgi:hypothetical protein
MDQNQNQNREENIQRLLGLLEQRRDSNDPLSIPINFVGANLEGFDSGDFEYAYLEGANFERANLKNADLSGFMLTNANLESAILTNANLTSAGLENANLSHTELTRTIFTNADLAFANFTGANIEDAIDITATIAAAMDDDDDDYIPQEGLAYEVHNKFTRIEQLKNQYLEIINQPNKQYEDIYTYIKDNFTSNIIRLFPDDSEKLNLFNTAFNQINNNDYFRIPERYIDLIGKSIDFAFSQDDEFKKQYIITFLDESCRAYSGPRDNLSCPKGIVERFILSVGSAAQILCTAECNNETYQKLDELFYPKFDIDTVSSEWWNNLSESKEVTEMSKEERKEHFKKYLRDKAKELNNYNDDIEQKITNFANEIDYSFENLTLGGRKTRKTKRTMKNKKTVKSKKNKKSRKSIRSTKSKKNRQTIKYKSVKKSGKTRKSKKY